MKDYTAILILILAVLISGFGFLLNYTMRKKDFQAEVFKKQFEAYHKIVMLLNEHYTAIYYLTMSYFFCPR